MLLLLLALAGVGAFAAAPFLAGPTLQRSGEFVTLPNPRGLTPEELVGQPIIGGTLAAVGLFGLVALLVSLIARRMGFFSLMLVYLAAIGGAGLLLVSLEWYMKEAGPEGNMAKLQQSIKELEEKGAKGEAIPNLGMQHYALAGGAAAASLFFALAGVFMHRRLVGKLLGFLVLMFVPALAARRGCSAANSASMRSCRSRCPRCEQSRHG